VRLWRLRGHETLKGGSGIGERVVTAVSTPVVPLLCSKPVAEVEAAAGTPAAPLPYSTSVAVFHVVVGIGGRRVVSAGIVVPECSVGTGGPGTFPPPAPRAFECPARGEG
jgi:hypothetical protein